MGIELALVRTSQEYLSWCMASPDRMGTLLIGDNCASDGALRGAVFGKETSPAKAELWVLELDKCWDLIYATWTGASLLYHLAWTNSAHPLRRMFTMPIPHPPKLPPPDFGLMDAFVGDTLLHPDTAELYSCLTPNRVQELAREWLKVDHTSISRRFVTVEVCYLNSLDEGYRDETSRGLEMMRDFYQRADQENQVVLSMFY